MSDPRGHPAREPGRGATATVNAPAAENAASAQGADWPYVPRPAQAVNVRNRSYSIGALVDIAAPGAAGVLFAHGEAVTDDYPGSE